MAEIKRKLASIQKIVSLTEIPGADKIELAQVLGWGVVVQKGLYKEGDLVIYLEIDSFVPNSVAPFLTAEGKEPKEYEGIKGERLKTIKLRKQLSQGLLLPISKYPQVAGLASWAGEADKYVGMDVTEALGIVKWEAAEKSDNSGTATGNVSRPFPYFLRKTDQERAQNYGKMIEAALDEEFEFSIKKDGSSLTVFRVNPNSPYYKDAKARDQKELSWWERVTSFFRKDEPVYGICSRNQQLKLEGSSNFHKGAEKLLLALSGYNEGSVALQAELVAPDIQGNYEKVKDVEVHIFDVFDIDKQKYKTPQERTSYLSVMFADKYGGNIPHATIITRGKLRDVIGYKDGDDVVAKCLEFAEGPSDNPGVKREGFVAKAMTRDFSFKAVSNSYLLATGK